MLFVGQLTISTGDWAIFNELLKAKPAMDAHGLIVTLDLVDPCGSSRRSSLPGWVQPRLARERSSPSTRTLQLTLSLDSMRNCAEVIGWLVYPPENIQNNDQKTSFCTGKSINKMAILNSKWLVWGYSFIVFCYEGTISPAKDENKSLEYHDLFDSPSGSMVLEDLRIIYPMFMVQVCSNYASSFASGLQYTYILVSVSPRKSGVFTPLKCMQFLGKLGYLG